MLHGRATPQATRTYAESHSQLQYRALGDTGLLVSGAGFGGYRVNASTTVFHEALEHALHSGINLIDTSTNYADGGSEELVGAVMSRLHEGGKVSRQAVVVVSKAGYLQGKNYERSQQRKAAGQPWPDLVPYAQGLEHCIHPHFLEDQLSRSLRRLQMETLDVYLLHNPEYYLNWAQKQGIQSQQARQTYYERIELAFRYMEQEAQRGRIQYYGISSNTFPQPATDAAHTSLARVWQIARDVAPEHHFRVVQMPANLLETGMVTEPNQPQGESVLALARRHNLSVLVNRPLNAIRGERLIRLADVPAGGEADSEQVAEASARLVEVEQRFSSEIRPVLDLEEAQIAQLAQIFSAGRLLEARWRGFGTYHNWSDVRNHYLVPRLQSALQFLAEQADLPAIVGQWTRTYTEVLNDALEAVDNVYAAAAARDTEEIKDRVGQAEAAWRAPALSQMAIRALRSTAGVTSVLVGMRRKPYVDDVLAELERDVTVAPRTAAWEALAQA